MGRLKLPSKPESTYQHFIELAVRKCEIGGRMRIVCNVCGRDITTRFRRFIHRWVFNCPI